MKWKKIVSVILAVCMVSGLAACGKDSGKEESKKTDNDSKDVELTVAIWDSNQEPGLRTIMDGFTEETGVKVDIQVTTWKDYWTMLEAAATGGDMPDVFWMHAHRNRPIC